MREIKFRAYWFDNRLKKKMTEPFDLKEYAQDHDGEFGEGKTPSLYQIKEGRAVIMQYTGLKDKNGKEIYEGDIILANWFKPGLEIYDESIGPKRKRFTIIWDTCVGGFYPFINGKIENETLEIIGNIYENPELLNSEGK